MSLKRILIVDDENLISWALSQMLTKAGFQVETAATGAEAINVFSVFRPQLVLLDLNLPDTFGLDLMETMRRIDDTLSIMIITAGVQADLAVRAFKLGAEHFFGKPFDMNNIKTAVTESFSEKQSSIDRSAGANGRRSATHQAQLIGNSPKMVAISKMIHVCASTDAKTVLITGESGTGKELIAQAIHKHSARTDAPFIEINCAAIPDNLIENELFGHERGAFTDASKKQKGIFEQANGGTVFLDEIGDMPLMMQTKLLKILETKRFRRLGGEGEVETDVRIIAATNQDLPQMVAEGKFRSDLYYRLNMINISIPPLRERREDIPALVNYFISILNDEYGRHVESASDDALASLMQHDWPGNVRELRNVIERAMMMEKGKTLHNCNIKRAPHHTPRTPEPAAFSAQPAGECYPLFAGVQMPPEGISFEEVEKQLLALALASANGNQTRAAKTLKMSRDTLRYRLKKFGMAEGMEPSEAEIPAQEPPVLPQPNNTLCKWATS